MRARSKVIRTRYSDIALRDSGGAGYPLLLLHGSGASTDAFRRQFDSPMLQPLRLLAVDLPGHGHSTDAVDLDGYSLTHLAEAVLEVLGQLNLNQVAVCGWSLGGHIAIEMIARSAWISGAMLVGTPPVAKGPIGMLRGFRPSWDMLLASKPEFTPRDARRFLAMCYGEGEPDELNRQALARADGRLRQNFFRSMMRGDGADQKRVVESAEIPIALVNGSDDPVVRLHYLETLAVPQLWTGKCLTIPAAGHSPFWSQAELFNGLLARFVRDVEAHQFSAGLRKARRA
ncbi:alpha/beta hydrolase [Devosia sp. 1566]|uniref:alpha/beta fold hydrolase n=1 Tax=Devosia sp. 1566 TaxID=2499144 RepID=UPI000FDAA41D|nr:alpha/beta hydrolase [Devosia sp. 1566]